MGASWADWVFEAPPPRAGERGWWFAVVGEQRREHGPYPTEDQAAAARTALFGRWLAAARVRGGWCWLLREDRWVVTLPRGHPVEAPALLAPPCTGHLPMDRVLDPEGGVQRTPPPVPKRARSSRRRAGR